MLNGRRRFVLAGGVSLLALIASGAGSAADSGALPSPKRIALDGVDPVSYFTPGQPERGSEQLTAAFDDSMYRFSSAEHRAMFIADPERYAPQYHAYCAGAMSNGRKSAANPRIWVIRDGKLYVFGSSNALAAFRANPAAMVEQANANWSALQQTR